MNRLDKTRSAIFILYFGLDALDGHFTRIFNFAEGFMGNFNVKRVKAGNLYFLLPMEYQRLSVNESCEKA